MPEGRDKSTFIALGDRYLRNAGFSRQQPGDANSFIETISTTTLRRVSPRCKTVVKQL
jgi:hypothetical protein